MCDEGGAGPSHVGSRPLIAAQSSLPQERPPARVQGRSSWPPEASSWWNRGTQRASAFGNRHRGPPLSFPRGVLCRLNWRGEPATPVRDRFPVVFHGSTSKTPPAARSSAPGPGSPWHDGLRTQRRAGPDGARAFESLHAHRARRRQRLLPTHRPTPTPVQRDAGGLGLRKVGKRLLQKRTIPNRMIGKRIIQRATAPAHPAGRHRAVTGRTPPWQQALRRSC